MKAWLNGSLVDTTLAALPLDDRGFTLGDGIFETIRVADGAPQHLSLHLSRLKQGAETLGIPLPFGGEVFEGAMDALLAANALTEGSLRLTLTRGSAPRGILPPANVQPTVLITSAPAVFSPPSVKAVIAASVRRNEQSPLARVKSTNFLDNVLARMEAARRGAEEAILLNSVGRVAEASGANLFALLAGRLVTPPVKDGALPGIARSLILAAGEAIEQSLSVDDLTSAEAIILSNCLGIRVVISLDGKTIAAANGESLVARLKTVVRSR